MKRFSRRWGRDIFTIGPGGLRIAEHHELIETLLGSCVAACMRDPVLGIGGMNHVMLPLEASGGSSSRLMATAYGSYAMEVLVNGILHAGGVRERLEVKLFGGGRMLAGMTDIGERNIDFMRGWVEAEGIRIVAEDLGGTWPRKVIFAADSGRVKLRRLPSPLEQIASRELSEAERERTSHQQAEPELF